MTESEPVTGMIVSDEAYAEAKAIVVRVIGGAFIATAAEVLTEEFAAVIQHHMNCAELAEAERRQAVNAVRDLRQRVREAVQSTHVDTWITCPRCSARAPSVMELRHEVTCRLSSAPPPRKSDVAPKPGREDES